MSKIIKSNRLNNYKFYEPRPTPVEEDSFASLLVDEEEAKATSSTTIDQDTALKEQLRLGYETGFKQGYEEGFTTGRREGFEAGYREGLREADKKLETERHELQRVYEEEKRREFAKIHSFLTTCEAELKRIVVDLDQEILKIVTKITEKVLLREVTQDRELILRLIKEALNYIAEGTEIIIRANPKDLDFLENYREIFPQSYKVNLQSDSTISPGGLFIETKLGVIDATFEKRWERILSLLEGKNL